MTRRQLLHALVEIETAIGLNDEALGHDSLDGAPSHCVMRAQRHLRSLRDSLRAELGLATVIPFPGHSVKVPEGETA